ncbi:hypothetical protein GSF67_12325 [Agrobacterium sp. CGMCC 11546]|nr:hypothetical protein GSF67_12325 [Agrobacterium sp. CGMCC 11546]
MILRLSSLPEIEAGLAEADRGEFASDGDVAKVVGKHVRSVRHGGGLGGPKVRWRSCVLAFSASSCIG